MKITIEKGSDLFAAWADDVPGIYGEGASVKEVKEDILRADKYGTVGLYYIGIYSTRYLLL
ncbi:MAG: hypothetical protein IJ467_04420 [Bacteroidaceae bacterium]|nr:hypothetical protein [Bacteroidaceae bacterium]